MVVKHFAELMAVFSVTPLLPDMSSNNIGHCGRDSSVILSLYIRVWGKKIVFHAYNNLGECLYFCVKILFFDDLSAKHSFKPLMAIFLIFDILDIVDGSDDYCRSSTVFSVIRTSHICFDWCLLIT